MAVCDSQAKPAEGTEGILHTKEEKRLNHESSGEKFHKINS